MTLRITPLRILLLVTPLLLIAFGLVHYDAYWLPHGAKQHIPAHTLLFMTAGCIAGVVTSFVPWVQELLGQNFWYKLHFVRSSPLQANLVMVGMRWASVALMWCIAVLTATGRG